MFHATIGDEVYNLVMVFFMFNSAPPYQKRSTHCTVGCVSGSISDFPEYIVYLVTYSIATVSVETK